MALQGMKYNSSIRLKGNVFSEESIYQQPVLDLQVDATLDPGASPSIGDRYLITNSAALHANFGSPTVSDNDILEYDGSAFVVVWDASAQGAGACTFDKDSNEQYCFNGTAWTTDINPDGGNGVVYNSGQNRYDLDLATSSGLELTGVDGSQELQIANDGVTTARINDGAVTDAKVASGIDAAKLANGSVSNAEFQYLDGVTSGIQSQIDSKQSTSEKGQVDGYASLDGNGKVPSAQLPAIAITEVFTAADITARDALTIGSGDGEVQEGDVCLVTDASADSNITAGAASYIYDGFNWQLLKAGDEVLSVNGQTGVITVNAINQLTGDVTTAAASGSESEVATISAGAVTTAKLAADAVDDTKLADDAVGAEHIQAGAVGTSELAADAVDSSKLADDAVGSEHLQDDSVSVDAIDYVGLKNRSAAANDPFTASLTRTFTHSWNTTDVLVEAIDSVTFETCYVEVSRSLNAVSITVNQQPANPLRILIKEIKADQTSLVVS